MATSTSDAAPSDEEEAFELDLGGSVTASGRAAADSTANAPAEQASAATTLTEQAARQHFAVKEYAKHFASLENIPPILVENLTVPKDDLKGDDNDTTSPSLQTAPNFASALLGRWVASKLRLTEPEPAALQSTSEKSSSTNVLTDVSALLLPGEGTLVLGPSSSGKSTLMRVLANAVEKGGTDSSIRLGNLPPSKMKFPRSTAVVDQGDLSLTPILTVSETVRFSRACAEGNSGDPEFLEDSLQAILKLVGLDHVQNTVVGNADIRGVSGGQKRRVKCLEMAVGNAAFVMLLDEITNGLDSASASALQICQVVSVVNQVFSSHAITSLLQPSQAVFDTFDRLILLTPNGQVAYSGLRKNAMAHFAALGLEKQEGLSRPEFLLQCAADPAGVYQMANDDDGGSSSIPPALASPKALAEAFASSKAGKALKNEMDALRKDLAEKNPPLPTPAPEFALSGIQQVLLLMGRGWKLVVRNPVSIMRLVMAILIGLVIGTLFLNTSPDADGVSLRAGYVLTLMFISFLNSSMAPLEDLYADRNTFYIHRQASFYRTVSYYISQILYNIPVAWGEAFMLVICSFFCVGMTGGAAGFFYFLLIFLLLALVGTAMARCLAYSLPNADMAQTLGPAVLLLFIMSTGLSPQYLQLPAWLRWIAWISPTAYAYEGILVAELRRPIDTDGEQIPGTQFGTEYLGVPRIPYDQAKPSLLSTPTGVMAFDAIMLIVLAVFFEICGCFLLQLSRKWYGPSTKRYQVVSGMRLAAPPPDFTSRMKKDEKSGELSSSKKDDSPLSLIPDAPKIHLTASNIVYEVDIPVVEEEDDKRDEMKKDLEQQEADTEDEEDDDDDLSSLKPKTPLQYGQTGNGKFTERLLERRLGEDAIHKPTFPSDRATTASSRASNHVSPELEPPAPGRLRLLSGITCSFESSSLTALMGSSGAGKTTLMDVLAGYKTSGHITGDIHINGVPKTDRIWKSVAGYCEQCDLHNEACTVRESLLFSARLRLKTKPGTSKEVDAAKEAWCDQLIQWLELEEFADVLIGNEAAGQGLPKHARKRLTVGVEWASNCSVLFADEPTSGLDSSSAAVVVGALKRASQQGLTVVCTIHQPSRFVFKGFDNLLLLRKGGVCVYQGKVSQISSYIDSIVPALKPAPEDNPADNILEVFCGNNDDSADWIGSYKHSKMAEEAYESNVKAVEGKKGMIVDNTLQKASMWLQFYNVLMRQLLAHWRNPSYTAIRWWWTIAANIIIGLIYFGSGKDPTSISGLTNTIGAMFFYVNVATVPLLSAVVPLITERAIMYREVVSGTYSNSVYGFAVQLAELPFNLGAGLISWAIFYWMVGLNPAGERVIYFILMALASYWLMPIMGQLVALLSPNIGAAVGIGSLLMTLFQLTMGFLIPANAIPPWYIWIYWINPLRYIQQGLTVNQAGGSPLGDAALESLGWKYEDRWWYCFVAVILFIVGTSIGIVFATRISWIKR